MARIPAAQVDNDVAERIKQRRGGQLRPLDEMLLWSPPVADGWNTLLGAIRTKTDVPPLLRELVILRVAVINTAPYEWQAHEPVARAAGADDRVLDAVRANVDDLESDVRLDAGQRLALAYTDAMTRDITVSDVLFAQVEREFGQRALVELTLTISVYNMVSRFLVALDVGTP